MKIDTKIGETFGRLKVLARVSGKWEPAKYSCECACGTLTEVFGTNLGRKGTRPNTESCGCLQRERASEAKRRAFRPFEHIYNVIIYRAGKREIPVDLSYEGFLRFTEIDECHYCGAFIAWAPYSNRQTYGRYHLDRKDSKLGYTKGNLVVCCGDCNHSKLDIYTYEEWVCMTAALKQFRANKLSFAEAR
jgi:hypothetical protein